MIFFQDKMLIAEINKRWDDLLSQDHVGYTLCEKIQSQNWIVKNRSLVTVLRPLFLTTRQMNTVRNSATLIRSAIGKVVTALTNGHEAIAAQFNLSEVEQALLELPYQVEPADTLGRLDGFFTDDGSFKVIEYNADSPAGIAVNEEIADLFCQSYAFECLQKNFRLETVATKSLALAALRQSYKDWRFRYPKAGAGNFSSFHIAIIDWADMFTKMEFEIFKDFFEQQGHRVIITHPDDVYLRHDGLYSGEFRIHFVYKRVLVSEFTRRYGLQHPIVEAMQQGSVCVSNGFRSEILTKKVIFSILTDPTFATLFSADEVRAIADYVPWTRKVENQQTMYRGSNVDLIPYLAANKNKFVLKPNDSYGGQGVVLGDTCTDTEWQSALGLALEQHQIVQERIILEQLEVPELTDGGIKWGKKFYDVAPYIWNGGVSQGCSVRFSKNPILNIGSGHGSPGVAMQVLVRT